MIKKFKKWWKEQDAITRKTAGLAEKQASMKMKIDAAMEILNKRRENIPVEYDRRKSTA